jgi:thiamine pyrophosphate-dependent acetolactate synthase large subunit-like protein
MLSREEAIRSIFDRHGEEAIYVAPTGYLSRAIYNMFPNNENIFYMQGSMGLSPGIALGIALYTEKTVVAINGDGGHLMHLGLTHTIRDENLDNLYVYILDNGVHESVGSQRCSSLEDEYVGITEIIKISCDGKTDRVGIGFKENFECVKYSIARK